MEEPIPPDFAAEYGLPARFCDYPLGSLISFLDREEVQTIRRGKLIYACMPYLCWGDEHIMLIILIGETEWWVPVSTIVVWK